MGASYGDMRGCYVDIYGCNVGVVACILQEYFIQVRRMNIYDLRVQSVRRLVARFFSYLLYSSNSRTYDFRLDTTRYRKSDAPNKLKSVKDRPKVHIHSK